MSAWFDKAAVKVIQETANTSHDTLIDVLIPVVQARFISESRYNPETAERTEYIKCIEAKEVVLKFHPVSAITAITLENVSYSSEIGSGYYTAYANGIIGFKMRVSGTLKVEYVAGYEVASIPPDILDACKKQIINWLNKIPDRLGKKSIGKGGETTTFSDLPLLDEFQAVCKLYNNPIPDRTIVA